MAAVEYPEFGKPVSTDIGIVYRPHLDALHIATAVFAN